MAEILVTTNWEPYQKERHSESSGNYIFLLKRFCNAPYYVGEAGHFRTRFDKHRGHFGRGERTFMRSPFFGDVSDKSHGGFVSHWRNYKEKVDPGKRDEVVWVPRLDGYCPDQVCGEGEEFWLTELVLLVFQNDLCRDKRRCVEAQIQVDVRQYHESGSEGQLNWSLPPRSSLFGRREKSGVLPILQYKLEGSQSFNNSGDFFRSLMDIPS